MQKVILSLKPKYAKMILKGKKFFELRRRVPKQPFKHILIYATKPVGMMIGEVAVKEIFKLPLDELWKKTKSSNGLTKQEFFKYFDGMEDGYAIEL
jgi:predicted transcriptional regulator